MSEKNTSVRAMMILEMIGRPPEHMVKTLNEIIDKINNEKNIKVIEKNIKEPVLIKDQKDLYSTFAEVEVEVESIMYIFMLMFKYMPSNIEIMSPEFIKLQNNDISEVLNEVTRKLHTYDKVVRAVQMDNANLIKKVNEIMKKNK